MERFFPLRAERVVLADVLETFPFPIAHTYRRLQEEMDRQEPVPAAWQLKDAYECAIKFAAALAVADALENGPSPDLSSELVSRLLKPLSIGDWQGLLEVASSSGAGDGRRGRGATQEQGGSCRLPVYAASSIARSAAERARYCSRWSPSGTTSRSMMRYRK